MNTLDTFLYRAPFLLIVITFGKSNLSLTGNCYRLFITVSDKTTSVYYCLFYQYLGVLYHVRHYEQ